MGFSASEESLSEVEALKLIAEIEREELNYRRKREMQIFSGTAAILLVIMGAVFLPRSADQKFIIAHGEPAQILAIVAIVVIVAFSVIWQDREWRDAIQHQQALTQIFQALGCFTPNRFGLQKSLFIEKRKNWGTMHAGAWRRVSAPGKILATCLLGALAIASILVV